MTKLLRPKNRSRSAAAESDRGGAPPSVPPLRNREDEDPRRPYLSVDNFILSLDAFPQCDRAACPVCHLCELSWTRNRRCGVLRTYMRSVVRGLHDIVRRKGMGEKELMDVGMVLLPQYRFLGQFQLIALGVSMGEVLSMNDRGAYSVHPIYREIRATQKAIDEGWRGLGYRSPPLHDPKVPNPSSANPTTASERREARTAADPSTHGDPSYYDAMSAEEEDE